MPGRMPLETTHVFPLESLWRPHTCLSQHVFLYLIGPPVRAELRCAAFLSLR